MADQMTATAESREADINTYSRVMEAIGNLDMVRESHLPLIVTVEEGVVTLSGVAHSGIMRQLIHNAVITTPGVVRVVDRLVDDTQLKQSAARALSAEPSLPRNPPGLRVDSYAGVITLSAGALSDAEKSKAREVVAAINGVQGVIIK